MEEGKRQKQSGRNHDIGQQKLAEKLDKTMSLGNWRIKLLCQCQVALQGNDLALVIGSNVAFCLYTLIGSTEFLLLTGRGK